MDFKAKALHLLFQSQMTKLSYSLLLWERAEVMGAAVQSKQVLQPTATRVAVLSERHCLSFKAFTVNVLLLGSYSREEARKYLARDFLLEERKNALPSLLTPTQG